jgi:hypothetical protein
MLIKPLITKLVISAKGQTTHPFIQSGQNTILLYISQTTINGEGECPAFARERVEIDAHSDMVGLIFHQAISLFAKLHRGRQLLAIANDSSESAETKKTGKRAAHQRETSSRDHRSRYLIICINIHRQSGK